MTSAYAAAQERQLETVQGMLKALQTLYVMTGDLEVMLTAAEQYGWDVRRYGRGRYGEKWEIRLEYARRRYVEVASSQGFQEIHWWDSLRDRFDYIEVDDY